MTRDSNAQRTPGHNRETHNKETQTQQLRRDPESRSGKVKPESETGNRNPRSLPGSRGGARSRKPETGIHPRFQGHGEGHEAGNRKPEIHSQFQGHGEGHEARNRKMETGSSGFGLSKVQTGTRNRKPEILVSGCPRSKQPKTRNRKPESKVPGYFKAYTPLWPSGWIRAGSFCSDSVAWPP